MLVLVLCHFHSSVVNSLIVQLLNFQKWWATFTKRRAAIPVDDSCCWFKVKCVIAQRHKTQIRSNSSQKAISNLYESQQKLESSSYRLKQKTAQPSLPILTFGRSLLLPTCFYTDPKNTYSKGRQVTAVLDSQAAFSGLTLAKYCSIAALTRSGTEQFFSSAKDCSCSLTSGYTTAFTCAESGLSLP